MPALLATSSGKIELEGLGDEARERQVIEQLEHEALDAVFAETLPVDRLGEVMEAFNNGATMRVSDTMATADYVSQAKDVAGLRAAVEPLLNGCEAALPVAVEFLCEGLHRQGRLRRESIDDHVQYQA